jgi:membrane associated rhomboid family serine protease
LVLGAVFLLHFVLYLLPSSGSDDSLYQLLLRWGRLDPQAWLQGIPEVWQLLTYGFLHAVRDPMHIVGNVLMLWFFGSMLQAEGGPKRFVLGASGHIAGVINPASKNKRSHWVGPAKFPADAKAWLASSTEKPGSWWTEWSAWLAPHGGALKAAPKLQGSRKFKAL